MKGVPVSRAHRTEGPCPWLRLWPCLAGLPRPLLLVGAVSGAPSPTGSARPPAPSPLDLVACP